MVRPFSCKQIFIGYYGIRYNKDGSLFNCGEHKLHEYLRIPENPLLKHSAVQLLWAIELASTILQDRPTRKQVQDICKISYPLFKFSKFLPGKANIEGYWRDLYRQGMISQFRYRYGPGSRKHFDVVYELTSYGKYYLKTARENQLKVEQNKK